MLRRLRHWVLRLVRWTALCLFIMIFLQYSTFQFGVEWYAIGHLVSDYQFDYIGWELDALATKTTQTLWGLHPFMDETERSEAVRVYFDLLTQAQQLDAQIAAIFTNPDIADPQEESSQLQSERDTLRLELAERQPLVEAILEGQVAAVLIDAGFGTQGQLLPPISMHFTQVPNLLITSPRGEIRMDVSINLNPMSVDQMDALEQRIREEHDAAALIVPLGGIALYPAMILETSYLPFALETFAHEWLHHYLYFFPLGLNYEFAGESRIINETTADLFGKELWSVVAARYYPELVLSHSVTSLPVSWSGDETRCSAMDIINPFNNLEWTTCRGIATYAPLFEGRYIDRPLPSPSLDLMAKLHNLIPTTTQIYAQQSQPFDFGAEMHTTRVHVDELLAQGDVDGAEAYMEERRQLFVTHGYGIRKLNQAYFAFYGGYQGGGAPGVAGEDPIGPAVRDIRTLSPSLQAFIVTMRPITSREQLLSIRDSMQAAAHQSSG